MENTNKKGTLNKQISLHWNEKNLAKKEDISNVLIAILVKEKFNS